MGNIKLYSDVQRQTTFIMVQRKLRELSGLKNINLEDYLKLPFLEYQQVRDMYAYEMYMKYKRTPTTGDEPRDYVSVIDLLIKDGDISSARKEEVKQGSLDIEAIWSFYNSTKFLVDIRQVNKNATSNFDWYKSGNINLDRDIVIDFIDCDENLKETKFYCEIIKNEYLAEKDGIEYPVYTLAINQSEGINSKGTLITRNTEVIFSPFITDRFFQAYWSGSCLDCISKCRKSAYNLKGMEGDYITYPTEELSKVGLLALPRARTENGTCDICNHNRTKYTFTQLLNICNAVLNKYCSRKTYISKKDNNIKVMVNTNTEGVSVDEVKKRVKNVEDTNINSYITVRDYVRYTNKVGSKHLTHLKPREHQRRPTTRTLKSGKVVPVRGSVVNKGVIREGNIIYKVDITTQQEEVKDANKDIRL